MSTLSNEAANFSWLLGNFVKSVPGVQHTLVVSADGLLMAMSDELDRTAGDQLSAIVSGLSSLTRGAARQLSAGDVRHAESLRRPTIGGRSTRKNVGRHGGERTQPLRGRAEARVLHVRGAGRVQITGVARRYA